MSSASVGVFLDGDVHCPSTNPCINPQIYPLISPFSHPAVHAPFAPAHPTPCSWGVEGAVPSVLLCTVNLCAFPWKESGHLDGERDAHWMHKANKNIQSYPLFTGQTPSDFMPWNDYVVCMVVTVTVQGNAAQHLMSLFWRVKPFIGFLSIINCDLIEDVKSNAHSCARRTVKCVSCQAIAARNNLPFSQIRSSLNLICF